MEEEVKKKKKSTSNTKSVNKKSATKKVSASRKANTKKVSSTKKPTAKKTSSAKKPTTKKISSTKKPTTKKVSTTKKMITNTNVKKKTTSTKSKSTSNKVKNNTKKTDVKEEIKPSVEKKDNKKTKIILDIVIYIFIIVVAVCLVLLYFQKQRDSETIKEIEETVISGEIEIVDDKTVKDYIDELKTKYNNNDIKGILSIDGLDVSIPIVKGKDNSYYLSHAVNKKKSVIGSAFIDYRNNLNSKQINIYGHNSTKFNPPFKVLEGYLNKEYYEEHKYFEFMVNDEVRKYEIFSVVIANKDNDEEHMQFSYKKDSDWLKHYQRLKKKSKYKIDVSVNKDDKIMVLQTCIFGRYHDKLLVIVGKEIERK